MTRTPIAVAEGDGIGPEIMDATLAILSAAGAQIEKHRIEVGEKMYLQGFNSGIDPKMWDILRNTKAFLKAPIITPQGGGFKSLNVTIRTTLGLYANIRPCVSYFPFVATKHPEMDVVIVRGNEEDLYSGIEYRQTPDVSSSERVISRMGSERIIRYAFEYAKRHNRKKMALFIQDNLLKFSDGLFHQVYKEISKEYPNILNDRWNVDIGSAKLADMPEVFDVIVMPSLYGNLVSEIAGEIAGSIGLVGSANIGDKGAMFEAIHGSIPEIAGQNIANPSGLLLAAIQMMDHIDQPDVATLIHNAWLKTIEDGIHTPDIFQEGTSQKKVGTKEFGEAVVHNLGEKPAILKAAVYEKSKHAIEHRHPPTPTNRALIGVDVYIYHHGILQDFFSRISHINIGPLRLKMITNRGVRVWPQGHPDTLCIEQWRCRFESDDRRTVSQDDVIKTLHAFDHIKMDVIKSEFLYLFDGKPGFSSAED